MPKSYNRDIIVVSTKALTDETRFHQEVEALKDLLYSVEDVFNVARSTEVIDLNIYRITSKKFTVVSLLNERKMMSKTFATAGFAPVSGLAGSVLAMPTIKISTV